MTSDGVVVAFHDARLDRVTEQTGAIGELTIHDVEAADAGYSHSHDGGRSFPFRARGSEATMHALLELGVDGIMTDRLRLLHRVFATRGLPLAGSAAGGGSDC